MNFDNKLLNINTLGNLKEIGYRTKTIKKELRDNLIYCIQNQINIFQGIHGFDHTVIPDVQRAVLSGHHFLLLGLRGQAKTRIARLMVNLLDEYIPVIDGSELNEDPFNPIARQSIQMYRDLGDDLPISWLHRSERYVEKLATPDVSVADLIGDIDPIKAANLRLHYADDRVIHYGIIPRSNRCIFVINELPDLQARIQVSLFNILQESDLQIRGYKLRMHLDIQFVFTANPEDYTNRGTIVTPLKDRIDSQILTHYPDNIFIAKKITEQEAKIPSQQSEKIRVPELLKNIIERIVFAARESEFVDDKSGVSSRLSISAYENLLSTAERRMLINKDPHTTVRISDLWGIIPSITGKIELVYEGELEGPYDIALSLIFTSIKEEFLQHFPNPEKKPKNENQYKYLEITHWFSDSHVVDLTLDLNEKDYQKTLCSVPTLQKLAKEAVQSNPEDLYVFMELILHGLAEFNIINRDFMEEKLYFRDFLADMLDTLDDDSEDDSQGEDDDNTDF